jgi:hypothetical protein
VDDVEKAKKGINGIMNEPMIPSSQPSPPERGVTLRSVLMGLGLLFLSLLWLERAGLITLTVQIDESVPPIPAVAAVMLLGLLNPLFFKLGRRFGFSQKEILVIYTIVAVGISMSAVGAVRMFFPCITAPFYFATPENNFGAVNKFIPRWFGPRDPELLRQFFEGAPDEVVPYGVWLPTVLLWTFFFTAMFFTFTCICTLFRRQWTDRERLTFPVTQLVLDIAEPAKDNQWVSGFFRNPLTWMGFSLSLIYNLLNILNAYNPAIPAPGKHFDLGMLFTERPLNALRPFQIWYRPELIGLGYLMSMEVLLSGWVFYLLFKLEMLVAAVMGLEIAGFPFPQEQATGAYLALMLALLYFARQPLLHIFKAAWGLRRQKAEGRRQKAEGRRQKAEGRRQRTEGRRQRAEGRRQRAEGRRQRAEGRRQRAEDRRQRAEGRRQRTEGRGQRAEGRR